MKAHLLGAEAIHEHRSHAIRVDSVATATPTTAAASGAATAASMHAESDPNRRSGDGGTHLED